MTWLWKHGAICIVSTSVASHLARSDTFSITCLVARLSRSDTPTLLGQPVQRSERAARERWPQGLHAKFQFCILNSP